MEEFEEFANQDEGALPEAEDDSHVTLREEELPPTRENMIKSFFVKEIDILDEEAFYMFASKL